MAKAGARVDAKRSSRVLAMIFTSSVLPSLAIVVIVGAPVGDRLLAFVFGWLAAAGLLVVSAVELVVGFVLRRRAVCLDAAFRALLVLALMSPLGMAAAACVPIVWSFVQTFDAAYACRSSVCEDAVVDERKVGGEMLTPQCYVELVRLADSRGGRAAAVAVLRRSWPSYSQAGLDRYAVEADLMPLGRGFWRAERCEDWNAPRSMRDLLSGSRAVAATRPRKARSEG